MKSILIFGALGTGMLATLLLGLLSGLIVTIIVYLTGCNIWLSRQLRKLRVELAQSNNPEQDATTGDDRDEANGTSGRRCELLPS